MFYIIDVYSFKFCWEVCYFLTKFVGAEINCYEIFGAEINLTYGKSVSAILVPDRV